MTGVTSEPGSHDFRQCMFTSPLVMGLDAVQTSVHLSPVVEASLMGPHGVQPMGQARLCRQKMEQERMSLACCKLHSLKALSPLQLFPYQTS